MVAVVGGCASLGSWHWRTALSLQSDGESMWRGQAVVPVGETIKYRYVVLEQGTSQAPALVKWEARSRSLQATGS